MRIFQKLRNIFLEQDDGPSVIALYIEGIDEPRRLSDRIAETTKKPILVYKTEEMKKLMPQVDFTLGVL